MTPAEIWKRGHADGLARRRDDEIYALDTPDARMYRDGHRMGRRELDAPPAPPIGIAIADSTPAPDGRGHIVKVAIPPPSQIPESVKFESPDHASAFSDPIPGKHKTKRAKPVDPDQASFL